MIRSIAAALCAILTISCSAEPKPPAATSEREGSEATAPPEKGGARDLGEIEKLEFEEHSAGLPASGNYAGVAVADLDGDGKGELLSGRRDGEEGLFLFRYKAGRWTSEQLTDSGDYGGVALADITGDAVPDIIAVKTHGSPKGLQMFATERSGGALEFKAIDSPYTQGCDDLDLADFDSDGDLDIAVSSRGVRVLVNSGDASSFELIELDSDTYEDTGIVATDVNRDGKPDILAANHPGKNVRLFLCESSSPLRFSDRHTGGLPLDSAIGFKIAGADFDGDGHQDLAVGTQPRLRLFKGNSCAGDEASWWREFSLADPGYETIQPVAADVDRDGLPDLVFSSARGLYLCLNEGGGKFGERLSVPAFPTEGSYSGCAVVDWDGDGDLDIVLSSFQGKGIHLFLNTAG